MDSAIHPAASEQSTDFQTETERQTVYGEDEDTKENGTGGIGSQDSFRNFEDKKIVLQRLR